MRSWDRERNQTAETAALEWPCGRILAAPPIGRMQREAGSRPSGCFAVPSRVVERKEVTHDRGRLHHAARQDVTARRPLLCTLCSTHPRLMRHLRKAWPAAIDPTEGGVPGRSRTCDPRFRKPVLYPAELRGREALLKKCGRRRTWSRGDKDAIVPFLSLSRGIELPRRVFQVARTHDVVALEHRAGQVSGQLHRHALWDAHAHQVSHGRPPAVMQGPARARPPRSAAAPSSASQANRGRRLPPGSSSRSMAAPFFALRSFPRTAGRCGSSESPDAPALPQPRPSRPPFHLECRPRVRAQRPTPCAGRKAARRQYLRTTRTARSRLERSKRIGRNGARSRRIDDQSSGHRGKSNTQQLGTTIP